ncbi:MAG: ArsA family ATPase [Spirochaetia bacterium]
MKTIFFTGKGGVGKSTLASAAAWQLAEKGNRVLAVSLDPAHNLGDIFHLELSHKKKRFKNTSLYLQETDLEKSAQEYLSANRGLMEEMYSYTRPFHMDRYFKVLKYSPGVEEYAALTSLDKILSAEQENFDYIVFDTPPTGLTLRILALPQITVSWIDRLIKIRLEILEKRHTVHNITGKYDEKQFTVPYKEEDDRVMEKLREMSARYRRVQEILQGPENSITLVFNPDFLSFRESERLFKGLMELNLPLRVAFDNKTTEALSETADKVEAELLKGRKEVVLQRVSLIDHTEPTCYIMDTDLTAHL